MSGWMDLHFIGFIYRYIFDEFKGDWDFQIY